MASKVFISYRREDSAGTAGRVRDRLAGEFGGDLLFMDVDGIPLGVNFVKVLQQEVAKCGVLLAVIGRDWLDVRDEQGRRRLDAADDFVRVEIAAALHRNIPVIPILLEGTQVPKRDQLPGDLQELALRNGLAVHHSSFHSDMDILIRGLRTRLAAAGGEPAPSLTPGAGKDGAAIADAGRGGRDTTPSLRWPQAPTPRSKIQGLLAALGIAVAIAAGGYAWHVLTAPQKSTTSVTTSGPQSPVVQDTKGDVRIDYNAPQANPR
jgi:hypothetical protein